MSRLRLLPALCVLAALVGASPASAGWTRPVPGGATGRFAYSRARRFAAGERRGVDLRAVRGAPVRAPCSGRVSFAGRVPGFGLGVSVRCGGLVATVLRLGAGLSYGTSPNNSFLSYSVPDFVTYNNQPLAGSSRLHN